MQNQTALEKYHVSAKHICSVWRVKVCRPEYFGQEMENILSMINKSISLKQDLRGDVAQLKAARDEVAFLMMIGSKIVIHQVTTKIWLASRPANLYTDFN